MDKSTYFNPKTGILKIKHDETCVGGLIISDLDQPAAYISRFKIKEKYRNTGSGSFALQSAIELAVQNGCIAVSLHCAMRNVSALRFYKRNGFFIAATTIERKYSRNTGRTECHYFLTKQINAA